jgi:hypothetical protein
LGQWIDAGGQELSQGLALEVIGAAAGGGEVVVVVVIVVVVIGGVFVIRGRSRVLARCGGSRGMSSAATAE